MIAKIRFVIALVLLALASPVWAQQYTRQGAVVGGAAGAVIGGLIGKQTDKTTGGAIIGGAVGALAGGAMGRNYDNDLATQRYRHQQQLNAQHHYYTHQYSTIQQHSIAPSGVTMADVISMSRSGVSDSVILSQVHTRGVQRRLEVPDIISLHQQGISDTVISAMQNAPIASHQAVRQSQSVIVQQPSVIVHEQPVIYSSPPVIYEQYRVVPTYQYRRGF